MGQSSLNGWQTFRWTKGPCLPSPPPPPLTDTGHPKESITPNVTLLLWENKIASVTLKVVGAGTRPPQETLHGTHDRWSSG